MSDEAESGKAGFDLEGTKELLNAAYETVEGATAILGMLYERLQEAHERESVEMAGVAFVLRRSLDGSADMICVAEEALEALKGELVSRADGEDGR